MYRLLENSGEPTKKQASGKSIRPRAAHQREDRPEEPAIGTVQKAPAMICWEASDQHGKRKTPLE
jgi:hypothetical protein